MEITTRAGGMAVSPIPENIIGVECELCTVIVIPRINISSLTEVIFSNKWWDRYNTSSITGTVPNTVSPFIFPCSSSKCPDVLSRTAMHYTHTTDIGTVNCILSNMIICSESQWQSPLVGSEPTTHLTIWPSTDREED